MDKTLQTMVCATDTIFFAAVTVVSEVGSEGNWKTNEMAPISFIPPIGQLFFLAQIHC
jgi:hypothetical protein